MLASDILDRVSMQLNDAGRVRWSERMLLQYLTDAMRQTVLSRPDASATAVVMELEAGKQRQRIPHGMVTLLKVVRNMGDGETPGRPVTMTTREAMDSIAGLVPQWEYDEVHQYAFVQATPEFFWVYPTPGEGVYVELECASDVDELKSLKDELPLSQVWAEPLREYVLYRAFSLNGTSPQDRARATEHLQQYYLALGNQQAARVVGDPYKRSFDLQTQGMPA